jgi:hypothetical protein
MIRLFVNKFLSENPDRNAEFSACLTANLENEDIDEVVFVKDINGGKPTYNQYFHAINKVVKEDDISIIANADIYMGEDLKYHLRRMTSKTCYALSRWEVHPNGAVSLFNRLDSQDTWIFKGFVKGVFGDFCIGTLGCDNRIAYELTKSGYRVSNPSYTIKTYHLHLGKLPNNGHHDSSVVVPAPYQYLPPEELRPFLSIVTRKHPNRPTMFVKCRASVLMQKDDDYEHVILEDKLGIGANAANRMFYDNRQLIRGQYVFILDDDDMLTSTELVGDMKRIVDDKSPDVVFIRMLINGVLYPTDVCWGKGVTVCHVGSFNLVIKRDLWLDNIDNFSDRRIGDFQFFDSIMKKSPVVYWQDKLYGGTQRVSHGQAE